MAATLAAQAQRLYQVFAELVRAYQFRDREELCYHGLSVSQCYTLDALDLQGPMTMGALAEHLHLEISTMTRIVDHLVARKLASRVKDRADRRVCRVQATRKGRSLTSGIRADLIKEHESVLRGIPPQGREAAISVMSNLLTAFTKRQQRLTTEAEDAPRRQCRVG